MKLKLLVLNLVISLIFQNLYSQSCSPVSTTTNFGTTAPVDTRYSYINCHQYVRTALLNNAVNMSDGTFSSSNISSDSGWISTDSENFVKVCRKEYAEAISFSGISGQPDHSALVLSGGIISGSYGDFASTPGANSYVYRHGHVSMFSGGGTKYNYYAALPKITGSSSISSGQTKSYNFPNKDYIAAISWSVSSPSLTITSSNGATANVKAVCNSGSGNYYVQATLTIKDSGETVTIKKMVNVSCGPPASCFSNTIDGNTLNTFNYVSPGTNHKVLMGSSRSWNKSSGYVNYWNTLNSGKEMNFSISSGCATFTASSGTCGSQTFTFCASSYRSYGSGNTKDTEVLSGIETVPFTIYNFSGQIIREGMTATAGGSSPLESLPDGFYILKINGITEKVYVKN